MSNTSNLPRSDAIGLLRRSVGGRDAILDAVYAYWLAKRQRWGKPILRRLQAPTNPQDGNPFNVFRWGAGRISEHTGFAGCRI